MEESIVKLFEDILPELVKNANESQDLNNKILLTNKIIQICYRAMSNTVYCCGGNVIIDVPFGTLLTRARMLTNYNSQLHLMTYPSSTEETLALTNYSVNEQMSPEIKAYMMELIALIGIFRDDTSIANKHLVNEFQDKTEVANLLTPQSNEILYLREIRKLENGEKNYQARLQKYREYISQQNNYIKKTKKRLIAIFGTDNLVSILEKETIDCSATFKTHVNELNNILDSFTKQLNENNYKENAIINIYNAVADKLNNISQTLNNILSEIERSDNQIKNVGQIESEIDLLQSECNKKTADLNKINEMNDRLNEAIEREKLNRQKDEDLFLSQERILQEKIRELENELKSKNNLLLAGNTDSQQLANLKLANLNCNNELESVTTQLQILEAKLLSNDELTKEMVEQVNQLNNEKLVWQEERIILAKSQDAWSTERTSLLQEIEKLKRFVEDDSNNEELRRIYNELNIKCADLNEQISDLLAKNKELEELCIIGNENESKRITNYDQNLLNLRERLKECNTIKRGLLAKIDDLENDLKETVLLMESSYSNSNNRIVSLTKSNEELLNKLTGNENELRSLKNNKDALSTKLTKCEIDLYNEQNNFDEMRRLYEEMKIQIEETKKLYDETLITEISKKDQELLSCREELAEYKNKTGLNQSTISNSFESSMSTRNSTMTDVMNRIHEKNNISSMNRISLTSGTSQIRRLTITNMMKDYDQQNRFSRKMVNNMTENNFKTIFLQVLEDIKNGGKPLVGAIPVTEMLAKQYVNYLLNLSLQPTQFNAVSTLIWLASRLNTSNFESVIVNGSFLVKTKNGRSISNIESFIEELNKNSETPYNVTARNDIENRIEKMNAAAQRALVNVQ